MLSYRDRWLDKTESGNQVTREQKTEIRTAIYNLSVNAFVILAPRLWKEFRPSYKQAFLDAADSHTPDMSIAGMKSATTDEVQRNEFRLLITYIMVYARMFDAFALLDGFFVGTYMA